ncbi:MAG: 2-C-methyl-D-erythritol 4-phosphate cytidylyltransferase [Ktedonobacterales bacterium]|nr:2-C-methyl-D-erythritol 4-phosphate cytidylyltransferase [Ktedonobacterales bacterium]
MERVSRRKSVVAIVLCAGQGTRMGASINKVYLPILGKPLVVYALETLERVPEISEIVLVTHPQEVQFCQTSIVGCFGLSKVRMVVPGGQPRHQSESQAMETLRPRIQGGTVDIVMIHDGARPFLRVRDVKLLLRAARKMGGALLATPVAEDERVVRGTASGDVVEMQAATTLWRAQTPHAFDARELLDAYDQARADQFEGTDTAASFERYSLPVQVVAGSPLNFKVTTGEDMLRAEYVARH